MGRWTWVVISTIGAIAATAWLVGIVLRTESADALVTGQVQVVGGLQTTVEFQYDDALAIGVAEGQTDAAVGDDVTASFLTPLGGGPLEEPIDVVLQGWEIWLVPLLIAGGILLWVVFEVTRARRAIAKG